MDIEGLNRCLENCDIYLEGRIISKELILRSFLKFLSKEAEKQENNGSIVLHLGSPCFDAVAIVWAAFAVIMGNSTNVDEIVRTLPIGDKVLYAKERGEFRGIEVDSDGKEWAVIWQGNRGTRKVGRKNWASILPYRGASERYDGRGIRSQNGVREKFLSEILNCEEKDIPGITDTSVIFVMDRYRANRYMNGLTIGYGDSEISILDLVTVSYFTDENEYHYGGNTGKNEAMLKFTSKISVGHDMTWNTDGSEHMGMFVCGNSLIEHGNESMEINQVMNRETLGFSFVCGGMDLSCGESLVSGYEKSGVFACTKDFLLENTLPPKEKNDFTLELNRQANAIIDREILTEVIPGEISWQDYRDFKTAVGLIQRDELDDDEKTGIVIPAWSLMKLFMTAPFSLNEMENEIVEGKIRVGEPMKVLAELEERLEDLPDNLRSSGKKIVEVLMMMLFARYDSSPKREFVKKYVAEKRRKKVAIVVPKAYYADIMWDFVLNDFNPNTSRIEIVSVNRFDASRSYDSILIVGNIAGKRFDIFRCMAAPEITVLLYKPEETVFRAKNRRGSERDKLFNSRQQIIGEEELPEEDELLKEGVEVDRVDDEITRYSEKVITVKFDAAVSRESGDFSALFADVGTLVYFEDGEGAMLTKYYEAYVLNHEKGEVEQRKADDLKAGDSMVFLNRDNDTKDIVDYILNELIHTNRIEKGFAERYAMARQWKTDLAQYMERTGETPARIVEKMIANGVSVHPVTIRNWLDEGTHTVGPRKVEYLEQIALLTENVEMFDHAEEYFEACRDVRHVRRTILQELGTAIIRRLEGEKAVGGIIPPEIQEGLDAMAVVLRIETIVKTDKSVPAYMTNRPIDLEGGL
ncbi:DrmE family protein [Enterocloster lavalensis]|uniref:DrmE family protein n=1 Tax=Enterocloster lavalensis TaxID=460384 RepID=UPI0023F1B820|nr:DrmE family protein [Enterocloster lavalensis]